MLEPDEPQVHGFKQKMLRSGRDLAIREVAGIFLSLLATVFIFRRVGPVAYGYVGVGISISAFLTQVGALGLNVFLIRTKEIEDQDIRELLTLILLSATVCSVGVWFSGPLLEAWTGKPGLTPLVRVVAVAIFAKLVGLVPTARLERELQFGLAASIDFGSLLVYYAVALPLVFSGWSYMGIWVANAVQVVAATVAYFAARPVLPAPRLRRDFARTALAYGAAYQSSVWVYSLRDLAAPVLLPRLAGMEAMGVVTATTQIVLRLGFFRTVVWRLSISGFSKLQHDVRALATSITQGMMYQAVVLGGVLSLFSALGSWLIPLVFTSKWDAVPQTFPFLAAAALVNGVFTLHTSALYVRGKIGAVTKFHVVFVAALWVSSALLVPRFGLWGYLAAEVVAMASYLYLATLTQREIPGVWYPPIAIVLSLVGLPLFAGPWLPVPLALGLWAACAGVALLIVPGMRVVFKETMVVFRG